MSNGPDAAFAAVKAINAEGGINGRKLELTFCDAKSNPNTTVACAHQAVSGKYVATVGTELYNDDLAAPIFAKAGLAQIGALANSPQQWNSPTTFAAYSGSQTEEEAFGHLAKLIGGHKVAIWATGGLPVTALGVAYAKKGIAAAGLRLGNIVEPPVTQTDPSAPVTQALSGGADVLIFEALNLAAIPEVVDYVHSHYPKVKIIIYGFDITPLMLSGLGSQAHGIYTPAWTPSPWRAETPGMKQFISEMDAYKGLGGLNRSDATVEFWLSVHMFAEIAKQIHGPITARSVLAQVRKTENLNLGGINVPFSASNLGKYGAKGIENDAVEPWVIKNGVPTDILKPGQFMNGLTGKIITEPVPAAPLNP